MRQRFFERFKDKRHCLIRLTEAQDPFFARLDGPLPGYRAIQTPDAVHGGRGRPRHSAGGAAEARAASCRTTASSRWRTAATWCWQRAIGA